MSWELLSFGNSELMFNEGGRPSTAERREVDLYVHVDDVDAVYERLSLRDLLDDIRTTSWTQNLR